MAQRLGEIQHTQLAERVRATIRAAILEGTFAPGERLVEEEIAQQVGLSRSPVREAIRSLQHEGLVASIPRRGAFVTQLTARDAEEVYTLRAALEVLAGKLVRADPDRSLASLEEIVTNMDRRASDGDVPGLSDLDVLFHRRLVEASGNRRVFQAWHAVLGQVEMLSRRVIDTVYADLSTVPDRHRVILRAITSPRLEDLVGVIEEHIHSVAERIVPLLEVKNENARALEA